MKIKTMIVAALSSVVVPVAVPLPAYTASASAGACMDRDERLNEIATSSQPPQSESTIVHLTNLMYVLDEAIKVLDRDCRGEPDYAQVRGEYKNIRDQTYTTCTQLATSPSVCVPKRWTGTGY